MTKLLGRFNFDIDITERRRTEDGLGWQRVKLGTRPVSVDVEIDPRSVETLARVAAHNRTKRSKSGPCIAKARFTGPMRPALTNGQLHGADGARCLGLSPQDLEYVDNRPLPRYDAGHGPQEDSAKH